MGLGSLGLAGCLTLLLSAGAGAQGGAGAAVQSPAGGPETANRTKPSQASEGHTTGTARWLDLQAATLQARYRWMETSKGTVTADQVQAGLALRARLKLDRGARVTVNAGLATGNALTSGWNATGIGTGDFSESVFLKHLFLALVPVPGLDVEWGSLTASRGEATEITHHDNDTYLTGLRLSLRRPRDVWLDEVTVTQVYLGEPTVPNAIRRLDRLDEVNYRQLILGKKIGKRLAASGEVARYLGVSTLRGGASVRMPAGSPVDLLRVEYYHRFGAAEGDGFAATGEKVLAKRVTLSAGYADIDPTNQLPNGDRYLKGRRLFGTAAYKLTSEFTASVFYARAVDIDFPIPNRTRFEAILSFNAANRLKRLLAIR